MSDCPPNPTWPSGFSAAAVTSAESFVVSVVRLWAAPYRQPDETHPDWREGFAAASAEDAQESFDGLFRIVVFGASRALDVRCLRCPHLGEDEVAFLRMVSLLQRHRWTEAETLLADWLPPDALHAALAQTTLFATAIAAAGLRLPLRDDAAARTGLVIAFPRAARESRSVH